MIGRVRPILETEHTGNQQKQDEEQEERIVVSTFAATSKTAHFAASFPNPVSFIRMLIDFNELTNTFYVTGRRSVIVQKTHLGGEVSSTFGVFGFAGVAEPSKKSREERPVR